MINSGKILDSYFQLNPSLPILAGLLAGIIPFAINDGNGLISAAVFTGLAMTSVFFLLSRKNCVKFGIFAAAGCLLALNARNPSQSHYDSILPEKNCGAEIEAEIDDTTCSPSEESSWMSQPYLMKIKVRRLKYSDSDTWRNTEGSSAVILPRECPRLGYGDIVLMRGAFILPEPPLFRGDFDFGRYLLANGIQRVFQAATCEILTKTGSFNVYRNILLVRDRLMNMSIDGMANVENKKIGAAINFGCRQGLSSEDRKNFLRSGTIHIFSISGMNVAIIAVMLFWTLRWMPFTARHLLIPAIVFLYVFTTGMPPPAVRAFLMISVWCIQKAFLYPSSSMNSIYLSAALILLFNPFALLDTGFQFSFIVAGFLVLSWQNSEMWVASALEISRWAPASGLTPSLIWTKTARTVSRALLTSLIAWLAGMGLSLAYQGIFVPSSIMVNFAIVPFVSIFVAATVVKIAFFCVPPIANFAGVASEWSLDIIRAASEFGASFGSEYLLKPPAWMIIVFYVALTVLAVSVRRKVFLCAATAIIFIVSGWYLKNSFSAGSIFILSGGESQEPVVAICPPGRRAAFVINSTSKHTARPLLNMFAIKGIDNIDTMLFCEARKESCAGSKYLLAGSNVSCVVLPARFRQSWFSRKTVEEACESGSEIKLIPDGTGIFRTGGLSFTSSEDGKGEKKCNICIFLPEKSLKLSISDTGLGVRTLEISRSDSNNIRMKLVNTDTPFIREFKF